MPDTLMPDHPTPALSVPLIIGGHWDLARQSPEAFTMIVVYRGLHCPICKSYLQTLSQHYAAFIGKGFSIFTVSMDGEERAKEAHETWELGDIPMGYGLTRGQAEAWGLYLSQSFKDNEPEVFAEPGLFWVRPDGRLYLTDVSNMPFARPDLGVLLEKADFILDKGYPARGTLAA
ncbi:redoxin domain-containing protein [Aestuariibius sp. 2305UL40-4]|uniref:redoxin domain-containing protein n=1 Tax=Aestuariibius violaceus TaxID=3234132 RepID=UPI00345E6B52